MFAANRYAYNLLLEQIKNKTMSGIKAIIKSKRDLIKKKNISSKLAVNVCPEECFDSAYRDLLKNIASSRESIKAINESSFKKFKIKSFKWKTKKDNSNSIEIRSRSIKVLDKCRIRIFSKYFNYTSKLNGIKIKEKLNQELNYSCRLQKIDDLYYLIIPRYIKHEELKENNVCAIDPGVRSFITGYDPNGRIFEFGSNSKMEDKYNRIRNLQSKLKTCKSSRKRARIKREIKLIYKKIKNCINDLHNNVSKWLSNNYKNVLLPEFKVKNMVKKDNRKINSTTARRMINWSHYKFKCLLKSKMKNKNGNVIDCTEEYTSKTCSNCGRLNHKLGASKVFICPFNNCNYRQDRDVNAARNIFIKNHKLLNDLL